MSDLFHPDVPIEFIQKLFRTMNECPHHEFQVLTKRAKRLVSIGDSLTWTPNIWIGVSVETQKYTYRAKLLHKVPAHVRFLSIEPLLGAITALPLEGIDWVIVGGESGGGARPMNAQWVDDILNQCRQKDVPFFFKQWGGVRKHVTGRSIDGRTYDELPKERTRSALLPTPRTGAIRKYRRAAAT